MKAHLQTENMCLSRLFIYHHASSFKCLAFFRQLELLEIENKCALNPMTLSLFGGFDHCSDGRGVKENICHGVCSLDCSGREPFISQHRPLYYIC